MKFSESWLRSLVNPALDSDALAHMLTMGGLEVEALEAVAPPFEGVVVGHVLTVLPHPQADRLKLLTVGVGLSEPLQIVCGAPNVEVGMKAPCAKVGARLPGGLLIQAAKVRGVLSYGMMCSEKELGLAESSEGLWVLAPAAPPGQDLRQWLDLDDRLMTLKLTPNRSDCLSVRGVAREVSALTGVPYQAIPAVTIPTVSLLQRPVTVEAEEACPLYLGRSVHLDHPERPTPDWLVRRLARSGMRSKGLVVDVTNYVLLELGQPLHAFDEDHLLGSITVRWAREGETLTLLNEQAVELAQDMLVIADDSGPLALAGVMGGLSSAVTPQSRKIFLESAFFSPAAVSGRARRLALSSDSAYRFERGVDFSATREALERATALLVELCGGGAGEVVAQVSVLPPRLPVRVRPERVRRVLGVALSDDAILALLRRQDFSPQVDSRGFLVTPPSYRFDLSIEEDFIEEVARLHGYDAIPALPPAGAATLLPAPESRVEEYSLARALAARDYQEVVTYSFVDSADEALLSPQPSTVTLLNPIASQMSVLRSSLAIGLVRTLQANLSRKQERVRIFEIGRCFSRTGDRYEQERRLGGLIYGARNPEQWGMESTDADFYDLKADVSALLPQGETRFIPWREHLALHPGRAAHISISGQVVGWMGELHPRVAAHFDFQKPVILFEIQLDTILYQPLPQYREISRFHPIRRDLAVLVPENVAVGEMLEALQAVQLPVAHELALFDLYQGSGVPNGKKSLAFRIVMQDTERTSTESDIEASVAALLKVLQDRFSAELR